ncbi:ABC transporter substrate-binding protein [Paracoccus ravus]|uniref:ABC transporter substrate-binding protein n=1 Tax=Paracoccus ravus TaxID=2447760 RepID=UPI0014314C0E|nr:ABC transporter substrate-binding protein [Paracoccus ravus]
MKSLAAVIGIAVLTWGQGAAAQEKITVTDLAGRTVEVPHGAKKVILGEGRMFYATVMFDKEHPFEQLAAIGDDLPKFDPDTWDKYLARFPEAKDVPMIGAAASADFSVEKALELDVDVLVVTLGFYDKIKESGVIEQLEKAGVPTVFVDFRERPTQNTVPSVLLLGRIFGKEAQAQAFVDYYTAQMRRVYMATNGLKADQKPTVFAERAAGLDPSVCCNTFGNFNFGEFIAEAGGFNIGSKYLTGVSGVLNPETLVVEDPDYILATGANWSNSNPGNTAVWLGYAMDEEKAKEQLAGLMQRSGFPELKAVKDGNVMAVYHQFYQSPYHFVAVQALAKWLHPELFADLNPQATFAEMHERFLPIDVSGVFWTELN